MVPAPLVKAAGVSINKKPVCQVQGGESASGLSRLPLFLEFSAMIGGIL